ncbi:hypothetical protein ACKWTF_014101 [Chironomus riparius]
MLDLLPKELIIEILNLLPSQSLIALTETCKLFNEIVSENSHLTENLELHFVPENKILTWTGYRKYSRVYLEGTAAKYYREIFMDISDNLKELQVICLNMEAAILKEILLNCVNLKKLLVKDNKISYKNEDFEEPLPQLSLHTLHYRNFTLQSTEIFKILKNCQVREMKIVGFSSTCETLRKFIKAQTDMQSFALHDADKNSSIFSNDVLSSVDFKLTKLTLDKYSDDCDGLENFLKNHRSSLQQVELNEVKQDVLKLLQNFPFIRKLKIFEMFFRKEFPTLMNNIKELTIGYDVTGSWAVNFPNLRFLRITWIRFKKDLIQIEELKKLDRFEIEFCCVPEFSIPSVRTLRLSDVGFSGERPFQLENNHIEDLTIEHCSHAEWLIEYLKFHSNSLKILRIKETDLSVDCQKVVNCSRNKFIVQIFN